MSLILCSCPFCGSLNVVSGGTGSLRSVSCLKCCARGPVCDSDFQAERAWNGAIGPENRIAELERAIACGNLCDGCGGDVFTAPLCQSCLANFYENEKGEKRK